MSLSQQTPLACGLSLYEDGIKDYSDLIKNKDTLIEFMKCMIENNRFEFISENNVQEFLENIAINDSLNNEYRKYHDVSDDYGIPSQGEI